MYLPQAWLALMTAQSNSEHTKLFFFYSKVVDRYG